MIGDDFRIVVLQVADLTREINNTKDTRFFSMKKNGYHLISVPQNMPPEEIDTLMKRVEDSGLNGSVVAADISVIKIT